MKYLRTEDGIYDFEDYFMQDPKKIMSLNENIIDRANTIEELCDAYVIKIQEKPNSPVYFSKDICNFENAKCWFEDIILENKYKNPIFYCSIWISENNEPILKPVAKMNKDRKLELL